MCWQPTDGPAPAPAAPWQPKRSWADPAQPKLLVCHDMMNGARTAAGPLRPGKPSVTAQPAQPDPHPTPPAAGYLQDALLQGGDDPGFYSIWHWRSVDAFVYFRRAAREAAWPPVQQRTAPAADGGRHPRTLPQPQDGDNPAAGLGGRRPQQRRQGGRQRRSCLPCSLAQRPRPARAHGAAAPRCRAGPQVLGTFITEWAEGRAKCEQLLASRAAAEEAAEQLVALALHHGFEGWLVNIENSLTPKHVRLMLHFVRHLTRRMREAVPHALVMWWAAAADACADADAGATGRGAVYGCRSRCTHSSAPARRPLPRPPGRCRHHSAT
jgi:hypothetical protein